MKRPRLSVVVPIYNVDEYLEKCIQSIVDSTYKELEIILVDDGSNDKSGSICDEYAQKDGRIIVHHKKNGGLVSARKAGVNLASGEFTVFVDGDDFIESDLLMQIISKLCDDETDLLLYGYRGYSLANSSRKVSINALNDGVYLTDHYIEYYDSHNGNLKFFHSVCTKAFRTEILKEIIYYVDDSVTKAEDLNFTLAFLSKCKSFSVDNSIVGYNYVKRESSMTHVYDTKCIENTANYLKSTMKLVDEGDNRYAMSWNTIIYNEGMNLVMSDCIGCAIKHYGRSGIVSILRFFCAMCNNDTFEEFFREGTGKDLFTGNRKRFAEFMRDKKFIRAFIMRLKKQVR